MKKYNIFIITGIISLGLIFSIFQYYHSFMAEKAEAVTVGTKNPGHPWSEMECSGSTLCIDSENGKVGIGTNEPTEKLDVSGNIKASGDICNGSGSCLSGSLGSGFSIDGICGSGEGSVFKPTTYLCALGTASTVTGSSPGPWYWSCSGLGDGKTDLCTTVAGGATTGQYLCTTTFSSDDRTISFGNGTTGCHWGGYAATNRFYDKEESITIAFDYLKANGYDSNLRYALSVRLVTDSSQRYPGACGTGDGYNMPSSANGTIWNNPINSTSYNSVTIEIRGSTGEYRVNSGSWTAIPNWSSIGPTYNIEFADYGYTSGYATSYFKNITISY